MSGTLSQRTAGRCGVVPTSGAEKLDADFVDGFDPDARANYQIICPAMENRTHV